MSKRKPKTLVEIFAQEPAEAKHQQVTAGLRSQYLGCRYWDFTIHGKTLAQAKELAGTIEIPNAGNGYREDEAYARFLLRKRLGVKRLPRGTVIEPRYGMRML